MVNACVGERGVLKAGQHAGMWVVAGIARPTVPLRWLS